MLYQKPTRLSEQAHWLIEAYAKSIKALGVVPSTDHFYAVQSKRQALENYIKAVESSKNDFTTPRFLLKAGKTALALGKKEEALKYFTDIKDNYDTTPEAASVDVLIGLAQ